MDETKVIYIELLEEGTLCWVPVQAQSLGGDVYRILGKRPEDQIWPFAEGETVICARRIFQGGHEGLVAVQRVDDLRGAQGR
jgi:hypothetical protein